MATASLDAKRPPQVAPSRLIIVIVVALAARRPQDGAMQTSLRSCHQYYDYSALATCQSSRHVGAAPAAFQQPFGHPLGISSQQHHHHHHHQLYNLLPHDENHHLLEQQPAQLHHQQDEQPQQPQQQQQQQDHFHLVHTFEQPLAGEPASLGTVHQQQVVAGDKLVAQNQLLIAYQSGNGHFQNQDHVGPATGNSQLAEHHDGDSYQALYYGSATQAASADCPAGLVEGQQQHHQGPHHQQPPEGQELGQENYSEPQYCHQQASFPSLASHGHGQVAESCGPGFFQQHYTQAGEQLLIEARLRQQPVPYPPAEPSHLVDELAAESQGANNQACYHSLQLASSYQMTSAEAATCPQEADQQHVHSVFDYSHLDGSSEALMRHSQDSSALSTTSYSSSTTSSSSSSSSSSSGTSDAESLNSTLTRDEMKAREANIPLSYFEIVNLSIEQFNERISNYGFSESQLSLMKDIRRRGKNKVAAQTCRKRKMEQIVELQQEVGQLMGKRRSLCNERGQLAREHSKLVEEYDRLCSMIQSGDQTRASATVQCGEGELD